MRKKKVLVAMSGGVDSSAAAALLVQQGYDCDGAMLKLAPNEDSRCCSADDAEDARQAATRLGMRFYVFNETDRFRRCVMDRFTAEYAAGRTPNPCIDCNRELKFGALLDRALTLGYDKKIVAENLTVAIPDGELTVIIGPNACGKSTLLRTLSRLVSPLKGQVLLDGNAIAHYATKEVARRLGLLPQSSNAPAGISVSELVARGRYPHQSLFGRWRQEDETAVQQAMQATGVADLAQQQVDTLSGGQRQRVWIAMVLAQQTPLLLLDEPTTWLDIAHQIELLELMQDLNQQYGRTLVVVLHDLNQACRYASHLIAMRDGKIIAEGKPAEIVTPELIEAIYGLRCIIINDPVAGTPMIVPLGRG